MLILLMLSWDRVSSANLALRRGTNKIRLLGSALKKTKSQRINCSDQIHLPTFGLNDLPTS